MARPKGIPKTGGRQKGTPNKNTGILRDMILEALNAQNGGGVEYLKLQAAENPTAFMTLLGKVLPMQLVGQDDGPVETVTTIKLVGLSGNSSN